MSMPSMNDEIGANDRAGAMGMPGMGMPGTVMPMPGKVMPMPMPGKVMPMPMPAMIGMPMSSLQGGSMPGMGRAQMPGMDAVKMPGMMRIQDWMESRSMMGLPTMLAMENTDKRYICPCCKLSKKSNQVFPWDSTISDLQRAAYSCPKCKFGLACVDWAVPRLFRHEDIEKIRVYKGEPLEVHLKEPCRIVRLEFFTLSGKSQKLSACRAVENSRRWNLCSSFTG
jgi:hypothetical protein